MKKTIVRSCIFSAIVLVLPGCLAINAILGVVGFMTTGPIQYAGTAYSIGEYTYEYAVNDKTPDEVIEEKLTLLMPVEEAPQLAGYAKAFRKSVMSPPLIEEDSAVQLAQASPEPVPTVVPTRFKQTPTVVAHQATIPILRIAAVPVVKSAPARMPIVQASISRPTPRHTYIERDTDPLLAKLSRLEQTLNQAERMAAREPEQGVRFSVPSYEDGQIENGINGSWSIRHTVMQPNPGPSQDSVVRIVPELDLAQSS